MIGGRMQRRADDERRKIKHRMKRPEWNGYLTDPSSYQLNEQQKLQKKIQMLMKIPSDKMIQTRSSSLLNHAKPEQRDRQRRYTQPNFRENGPNIRIKKHERRKQIILDEEMPKSNFDAEVTEFLEGDKKKLHRDLDRMDKMLVSLELQADRIGDSSEDEQENEDEGQGSDDEFQQDENQQDKFSQEDYTDSDDSTVNIYFKLEQV